MDRIAFITDLHLLERNVEKKGINTLQNWKTVLEDVKSRGISKIILGGDFGEKKALNSVFNELGGFDVGIMLGNHDKIDDFRPFEPKTVGKDELFYTTELNGSDTIFLDTSSYTLSHTQQDFFGKWLETAVNPLVFIHHPVLDIETWMDREHPLKNRHDVEEIITKAGKKVTLICGHYHQYHEKYKGLIRQIIGPAVCYQIPYSKNYQSDKSTFGYLILKFEGGDITVESITFKK